jgi:hypothetical protein
LDGPFAFKTAAHRALVLEVTLNFFPVQMVISQRRVDFGRGQRRQLVLGRYVKPTGCSCGMKGALSISKAES